MIKIKKKGQEEMLGFALIMIIVAVILLVFLGFSLKNSQKEAVKSYEVDSFIQTFLQYTTNCADKYETDYLDIQDLVFECEKGEFCLDERDTCEVLELESKGIIENSWKTGEEWPIKGYSLNITSVGEELLSFNEGNITNNYKWSVQILPRDIEVYFTAYY